MNGWNFEHTYAALPKLFYRCQTPTAAPAPEMVVFNQGLAQALGLNADQLKNAPEIFAGTELPPGAKPIAQAYAGFQFGHFAMLGDGRAVLLGEQITPDGRKFDIQLKGSGKTPYSRQGDGQAALSPMLREYIISEAMFALGIPTTRSLAVALTGKDVIRETILQGAVLTRAASSHIRVGTFHYIAVFGTEDGVRKLADYCIRRHFPWLEHPEYGGQNKYLLFFREVARLQAALIAKWQLVGFVHGVMNTDNMAISGETMDYGPCAFLDAYDPGTVFSSIDTVGRYAYKNQPIAGARNLSRLAESLLPLLHERRETAIELGQEEIATYWNWYNDNWLAGMRAKLGLFHPEPEDADLIIKLLNLMERHQLDYTNTFHTLSASGPDTAPLFALPGGSLWQKKWRTRLAGQPQGQRGGLELMRQHNPAVIPRNHRIEEALAAAELGDFTAMDTLLRVLGSPYEVSEAYASPPEPTACKYKTFCGT